VRFVQNWQYNAYIQIILKGQTMSNKSIQDFDRLWNYDDPAQSERDFKALVGQGDLGYQLQLLTQIARAQGLQRHFAEAHATLDEVERYLNTDTETAHVRYLLERGRVYNTEGNPQQARPLFEGAWELANRVGEISYAVDAAHMLGILDAPDLTWNLKALEVAESSSDERARRWRASLYNNIGWSHHDRGDYAAALSAFGKALRLREEQDQPDATRIARWAVARTLRSLGRYDEALGIQRQLATQAHDGYVDEELGELLLALGRAEDAKPHFARAYAELSLDEWLAEHEPERLERLQRLGTE
jgi:tetratricopeptide (TPR) repeat protein